MLSTCRIFTGAASLAALLLFYAGLQTAGAQQPIDPSHFVPAEKKLSAEWNKALWHSEQKVYKGDELTSIGMPCGGIAAGQLYVRGDGSLANWWISNNAYNTGYGKDSLMNFQTALGPWKVCYQPFTPPSYIDQGFAITVKQGSKKTVRQLNKKDFDDISFIGEYPIARIGYASRSNPLPVKINMEVFSPFIPLNAKESATPGTIISFTVTNQSAAAMEISLNGWLQNLVCLDLKGKIQANSRNRVLRGQGISGVYMDLVKPVSDLTDTGFFPQTHPYAGNISLSVLSGHAELDADYNGEITQQPRMAAEKRVGEKLVGSAGSSFSLKPGETGQLRFLLTWYFPNRPSYYYGSDLTNIIPNDWNEALPVKGATILGNMYANWFGSSTEVAVWLQENLKRLTDETHLFHDAWYRNTTLPYWLAQRILMPVSTLATETCQWWANDKFWAWEGVGSCVGTCTHVWNYEQALAHLFPELERNIREKTDFGSSFQQDGSVLARNGWGDVLIDGHAGAILKAYRENLWSSNNLFLARNWDKIKRATEYLISQDENADGLIERTQANTYDIAFYGANTYVGGLYLAALKAAAKMAGIMHDELFADSCNNIFNLGMRHSVARLWNGEYFIQDVDLNKHPKYQYGKGCLSDQLFGQTWSHLLGLGYIYPEKNVKSALESIYKYNWAADIGPQNSHHPPERVYADPGEPGLLVCTWPHSAHMGEDGVRYRDEVWTGIEYQVATNMIYDNMIPEGLSLIKGVHDRYNGKNHNPWNEIECGDHYARAMASYGVLLALENYQYNGPAKSLGFSPKLQQDHFSGFFTAAEGWGTLSQERTSAGQTNRLTLNYGKLHLTSFETDLVKKPERVSLRQGNWTLPCTFRFSDNHLVVDFKELVLAADQQLNIVSVF